MAKKVENKDLFSADLFSKTIADVKDLVSELDKLDKAVVEVAKNQKKILSNRDDSSVEGINSTKEAVNKLNEAEKTAKTIQTEKLKLEKQIEKANSLALKQQNVRLKAEEKEAKLKKKAAGLTDDELKSKIKLSKAAKQRRKDIEAELILENKSINSRNELRETIRALRIEADKLDLGSEELVAANKEIDELDASLKDMSDQFIQNKINIGNYKDATIDLTHTFEDQKKKLKILEDTYKDSVLQGKKNTKEFKNLTEELKDQRKVVGDVADSMDDLKDASKGASEGFDLVGNSLKALGIGLLLAVLAKLADLFGSSRKASLEASQSMAVFTETIKTFFVSLVKAWDGFKTIIISLGESLQSFFISFEKGYLNMLLSIEKGKGIFTDTTKEVASLEKSLSDANKKQKDLSESTNTLAAGYGVLTSAFAKQVETTGKAIDFEQKYLKLQQDTQIQIEAQTRALGGLAEKRQILQDISDDDTLGFETRALAVAKAQKIAVDFANKEIALAKLKENLTIQEIKGALLKEKILTDTQLEAIKSGEDLNKILKDKNIALAVSDEQESAFTEAFVERKDKEVEAESFLRDQQEKNRKTFRDSYEQRNDIIVEFGELQFALNEAILNDEKSTQKQRSKAFNDNQKLSNDLLKQSVALTIEQANKSLDINEKAIKSNQNLTKAQKDLELQNIKIARAKLLNIDLDKILNAASEQERFELIRKLDLGEIEEKVLKDSFKIKFDQNNSLIEQGKALKDINLTDLETKKDIAAQEIALGNTTEETLEDLAETRELNNIENLRTRLALEKEGSTAFLNIQKELNDALLNLQTENASKEKEIKDKTLKEDEERLKAQQDLTKAALSALASLLDENFNKNIEAIEVKLSATEKRINELQNKADQGRLESDESLTLEKKRAAELEKEKIREQKRQERTKAFFAVLDSFNNNKGDIGKTITDVGVLKSLAGTLTAFDGVDDTGGRGEIDSKGGKLWTLHPNEQVWSKKDRGDVGFRNREEIKDIVNLHDSGAMSDFMRFDKSNEIMNPSGFALNGLGNNKAVVNELKGLKRSIESIKIPETTVNADELRNIMTITKKTGNKVERQHSKLH